MTNSVLSDVLRDLEDVIPGYRRPKHKAYGRRKESSNGSIDKYQINNIFIGIIGSILVAIFTLVAPATEAQAASAADASAGSPTSSYRSDGYVASSRSFAPAKVVRRNLLAESVSVKVEDGYDWGGVENLDVPKTKSLAEIAAEREAARRAEEARQAEIARQQAEAAAEQAAAASRSAARNPVATPSYSAPAVPASGNGQSVVNFAMQYIGSPYVWGGNDPSGWDCSGFVKWVYAHFGVTLPRVSGDQAGAGYGVGSLSQAMPGDIIANSTHAAIYIGNGQVVNALNPRVGTVVTPIEWAFPGGYSIRRVM